VKRKSSEEEQNDDEEDDDDDQKINLDELLDELNLDDGPDNEDEDEDIAGVADGGSNNGTFFTSPTGQEGITAARDGISYVNREAARTIRDKESAVPITGGLGKEFTFK
jgi:hypothetical protein